MAARSAAAALPQLSNEAQLKIMNLVKQGMSMDEALKRAVQIETEERKHKEVGRCIRLILAPMPVPIGLLLQRNHRPCSSVCFEQVAPPAAAKAGKQQPPLPHPLKHHPSHSSLLL